MSDWDDQEYIDNLEGALSAAERQIPRWTPVTERLPELAGSGIYSEQVLTVLDWSRFGGIKERLIQRYMNVGGEAGWEKASDATVTHWMPLPEPPEVE